MTQDDWNVATAVASAATALLAALVFWEARTIRQTEWLVRQNQAWNDLCNHMASAGPHTRIPAVILGESIQPPLTSQEAFMLMSYFNVVSNEYNSYRARAIKKRYVLHSFSMTASAATANQSWIFDFLKVAGYDGDFRRAIAILVAIGDDLNKRRLSLRGELRAASHMAQFCGPRIRKWLRRHINEDQIQTLCGVAGR